MVGYILSSFYRESRGCLISSTRVGRVSPLTRVQFSRRSQNLLDASESESDKTTRSDSLPYTRDYRYDVKTNTPDITFIIHS